ncbi:MAG TPA: hypothetical protein G4O10_07620 [Dehalococcoidia bacterium]|nr:hypothetical protein [Dehalococcoidia bacterium]
MKRKVIYILFVTLLLLSLNIVGAIPASAADPTTIESSTMVFEGTLVDEGGGIYSGVEIPMVVDGGFDIYAEEGSSAWMGDLVGGTEVWDEVLIVNHDAWPGCPTDTPDWYQYSLTLYYDEDLGVQKWMLRNHPGATEANPWYDDSLAGWPKPAAGMPMSGVMDWSRMYAAELDFGHYYGGTGTPEIENGAAWHGGGLWAWDMDWSWGSEMVPLQYVGFSVEIESLPGDNQYRVTLTPDPSPVTEVWVDDNWAGTPYGTEVEEGKFYGYNAFSEIQKAVKAVSHTTIYVAAGTYVTSGQIVINEDLTIIGEDPTTTIIIPDSNTGTSGDSRGWFLVNDGIEFHLSNVTLDGTGYLIYQGIRHRGYGSIDNVNFTEIRYNESGPTYAGLAVVAYGTGPVDISDCSFSGIGRVGVLYYALGGVSTFSGNTYIGKGDGDWLDYALDISAGAIVDVNGNTISSCRGVASSDGSTSAGILVTTYYGSGTEVPIIGNTLTDSTVGIAVGYDGSDTSTVVAHYNQIYGNDFGAVTTAQIVDATYNWWGDVSGPYHQGSWTYNSQTITNPDGLGDEVTNQILYEPWLGQGGFVTGGGWIDSPEGAAPSMEWYFNGFEVDTYGWFPWGGTISRVASGTNGVPSADGNWHAEVIDAYTNFSGYSSVFPAGGFRQIVDVYIDSSMGNVGDAWALDNAINGDDGIWEEAGGVGALKATDGNWWLAADGDGAGYPGPATGGVGLEIDTAGWYTIESQWVENTDDPSRIDRNTFIYDSTGIQIYENYNLKQVALADAGGNRYGWFLTPSDPIAFALPIDNSRLIQGSPVGKATFGFVAKYNKGANAPDGNTEFVFRVADLNFHSTSYDWLVVTGSSYARFKGTGTINGIGEYRFLIWAGDDEVDTFRIKIWYEVGDTEIVVYDNGMDQEIGGGQIVIHTKEKK